MCVHAHVRIHSSARFHFFYRSLRSSVLRFTEYFENIKKFSYNMAEADEIANLRRELENALREARQQNPRVDSYGHSENTEIHCFRSRTWVRTS